MNRAEQLDYLHWLLATLEYKGLLGHDHADRSQKIVRELIVENSKKEVSDETEVGHRGLAGAGCRLGD